MSNITVNDPRFKQYGLVPIRSNVCVSIDINATKLVYGDCDREQKHVPWFSSDTMSQSNVPGIDFYIEKEDVDFLIAKYHKDVTESINEVLDECDNCIETGLLEYRKKRKRNRTSKLISSALSPTRHAGHIYVMRAGNTSMFKIGYTTRSPLSRMRDIQTSCPYELDLYSGFETDDCLVCEARMHGILSEYRTIGEWFDADTETIDSAIDSMFR